MDTAFDYVYGLPGGGTYFMDANVVIASGVDFAVSDIVVMGSHILVNNGVVDTDIEICDGCRLEIYNRGVFSADFSLGNNASVVQVMSDADDLSGLDINVDYSIRVDSADGLRLSDIMRVGLAANEILLTDSFIVWDEYNFDTNMLKLFGDIKLEFNDIETALGRVVLSDVSPDAYVQIMYGGVVNPLFALKTYVDGSDVYSVLVRETDYTKILDKNLGGFINSLRGRDETTGVLSVLDNAISIDGINQIMADSVRIAPINLMNYVSVINAFNLNGFNSGFGVRGDYIVFDDFSSYGVTTGVNMDARDIRLGVRLYSSLMSMENFGDSFSGVMLGGDIDTFYESDMGFMRGRIGANMTQFNIYGVFDGVSSVDNPVGYSSYVAFDIGRRNEFDNGIHLSPYVGGTVNWVNILGQNESEYVGRFGADVGYDFEEMGIKYDYAVRMSFDTNADLFIGGRVEFMSVWDSVGGYAEAGYINNKTGQGYKISAGVNFAF